MPDDLNQTQQDMRARRSWYEPRRPSMGDEKNITLPISWSRVGPFIGVIVFLGGLVGTSVNAVVTVAQYKDRIEEHVRKLAEMREEMDSMHDTIVRLEAHQEVASRLQLRISALEAAAQQEPVNAYDDRPMRYDRGMASDPEPRRGSTAAAGALHDR